MARELHLSKPMRHFSLVKKQCNWSL